MKRVTLIALSAIFALGLAACDRPASTDRSAQRSTDQSTDKNANKPGPANPTPPTGTPPSKP